MEAVLTKGTNGTFGGSSIRQEVEKIAAWIFSETGRNRVKQELSQIDAKRFPSPKLRWHLGIRSSSKPADIMLRVYEALKEMNFEWHVVSPYQLIVRPKFDEGNEKVTFEVYFNDRIAENFNN